MRTFNGVAHLRNYWRHVGIRWLVVIGAIVIALLSVSLEIESDLYSGATRRIIRVCGVQVGSSFASDACYSTTQNTTQSAWVSEYSGVACLGGWPYSHRRHAGAAASHVVLSAWCNAERVGEERRLELHHKLGDLLLSHGRVRLSFERNRVGCHLPDGSRVWID